MSKAIRWRKLITCLVKGHLWAWYNRTNKKQCLRCKAFRKSTKRERIAAIDWDGPGTQDPYSDWDY